MQRTNAMGYYDLSHSMGRWISFIYRMSQSYVDQYFKRYNLSSGQFVFLLLLYREDGRKQDDLAKAIDMDKGTTARALAKLEASGYIVRIRDEKDRRVLRVHLTDKAREVRKPIYDVLHRWNEVSVLGLTPEENQNLLDLLRKVSLNIRDQKERGWQAPLRDASELLEESPKKD